MKGKLLSYSASLLGMIVILVLTLTACTPAPAPTPTPTPKYTVNVMSKTDVGSYLVDDKGMTLYYFTRDTAGKSSATAAVLANWPIFNPASFEVPPSLNASDFATITRENGLKQATYKDWPLYYYIKDQIPGDTLGEGLNSVWFIINPTNFMPPKS